MTTGTNYKDFYSWLLPYFLKEAASQTIATSSMFNSAVPSTEFV